MREFRIDKTNSDITLFKYVRSVLKEAPKSFIYKLFRKKDVKVNKHWQNGDYILKENDIVSIYVTDEQINDFIKHQTIEASNKINDIIVYEDQNVLIINKPRGLLLQPDSSGDISLDMMVKQYLAHKNELDDLSNVGPSHRLDRNTSGLVIFGKNLKSLNELFKIVQDKTKLEKHYLALVRGIVDKEGVIDMPLNKNEKTATVYIDPNGKQAISQYKCLETFQDKYSLVDVLLLTGRTHQIRVHLAYINHPIIGDRKYGDFPLNALFEEKYGLKHQYLHAYKICFKNIQGYLSYLNNRVFIDRKSVV